MSSTLRGSKREANDYYVTPRWAIMDFLTAFCHDAPRLVGCDLTTRSLIILDPCAGGDEKRGMAYPDAIAAFNEYHSIARVGIVKWHLDVQKLATVDVREDSRAAFKLDYLKHPTGDFMQAWLPHIIITNPPFLLAMPIIEKALEDVRAGGLVIMLLRLNFFGGQKEKRAFFERAGLPVACYVHRKRMGFMPKGAINPATGKKYGQDSCEYAHFVWQQGNNPEFTKLRVI